MTDEDFELMERAERQKHDETVAELRERKKQEKIAKIWEAVHRTNLEIGQETKINCPICKGAETLYVARAFGTGKYFIQCTACDVSIF